MTTEEMVNLGWLPEKIESIRWQVNGRSIEYVGEHGMLSMVCPSRDSIIVIKKLDETGIGSKLEVLNADGTSRFQIPPIQKINEVTESGRYCWFEPARTPSKSLVGVVFESQSGQVYQLDIDVFTGKTIGIWRIK